MLAQAGVLDTVRHTSNCAANLRETGYAGAALYQDMPWPVADDGIVTAPGTARRIVRTWPPDSAMLTASLMA